MDPLLDTLHEDVMNDRFTPRDYKQHRDESAAERDRLEHELDIPFHSSDRLDAMGDVDTIRTGDL